MKKEKNNQFIALVLDKSLILTLYILSIIFLTLLVSHQQIIVGTVVNSLLFFTSFNLSEKNYLPIAIFPSLVAILQGLLFGKFTVFLIYFLPFIWLSNYLLIIFSKKINWLVGILIKVGLLFFMANLYFNFKIVPKMFLQAMGVFQLMTAVFGYLLYLLIDRLVKIK